MPIIRWSRAIFLTLLAPCCATAQEKSHVTSEQVTHAIQELEKLAPVSKSVGSTVVAELVALNKCFLIQRRLAPCWPSIIPNRLDRPRLRRKIAPTLEGTRTITLATSPWSKRMAN